MLVACTPTPAATPGSARIYRVGLLSSTNESGEVSQTSDQFQARLGELGYTIGENLAIERRGLTRGAEDANRLVAAELAELPVDVIVSPTSIGIRAAVAATSSVPIVMLGQTADPVASSFIESLARPGGNVTGVLGSSEELDLKRAQLLVEAIPGISKVAVLGTPGGGEFGGPTETLRIELFNVPLAPEGWEATLARATQQGADAILARVGGTVDNSELIGALSARYRLPGMFPSRPYVRAGGLIAYAARSSDIQRRGAEYVDRILRGASPAELPVELPTRYDLIVNMRTARALGIAFPSAFLAQVTEVIE